MEKIVILVVALFLLVGCGSSDGDKKTTSEKTKTPVQQTNSSNFDASLRGNWMYINDGTVVYIDENFKYPVKKRSSTLIEITKDNKVYHLMRSGIDTTIVKGDLYSNNNAQRSIARGLRASYNDIGSIDVILQHVKDKKNKKEKKLKKTGDFSFQNVTSGEYTLQAKSDTNLSVKAKVDVSGEEVSLGSFKLVSNDGYNFKTDFVVENSDDGYFYGNLKTYTGKLEIHNIGNKQGTGLNYSFHTDSGYVEHFSNDVVLGTVEVNKSIEIPFSIAFTVIDKARVTIPLNITIKDVHNHEWNDTVFFHVYQTPMTINIKSKESNVNGYIIAPGNKLTKIDASDASIEVPYRAGKNYYLVLSNPDIKKETAYSIGVNAPTLSFDTFQDTSSYEPNDIQSQAVTMKPNENIISYLHVGDIDYYKIDMSTSRDVGLYSPPQVPFR